MPELPRMRSAGEKDSAAIRRRRCEHAAAMATSERNSEIISEIHSGYARRRVFRRVQTERRRSLTGEKCSLEPVVRCRSEGADRRGRGASLRRPGQEGPREGRPTATRGGESACARSARSPRRSERARTALPRVGRSAGRWPPRRYRRRADLGHRQRCDLRVRRIDPRTQTWGGCAPPVANCSRRGSGRSTRARQTLRRAGPRRVVARHRALFGRREPGSWARLPSSCSASQSRPPASRRGIVRDGRVARQTVARDRWPGTATASILCLTAESKERGPHVWSTRWCRAFRTRRVVTTVSASGGGVARCR